MIEIRELTPEQWKDYELHFSYDTDGYYTFDVQGWDFHLVFHPYQTTEHRSFTDRLFGEWLENPLVFGAFYNDSLIGVVEGFLESWNNRFRITNLLVWDNFRNRGIGKMLIEKAMAAGRTSHARMVVLETQTCNHKAIDFYIKMGFQPIGFDLYCYTNNDPVSAGVRLEMAQKLPS